MDVVWRTATPLALSSNVRDKISTNKDYSDFWFSFPLCSDE